MTVEVRQAEMQDVAGIAEVIRWALGDDPDEALIACVLEMEHHATYVGVAAEKVVGFASGFLTTAPDGTRRWELDLLGVHPDFRRQGIGRSVIQACTRTGQKMGAIVARGLVAVGNTASQKAFRYSGYAVVPEMCGLYVSTALADEAAFIPGDNHTGFIPVTTLTYRGLWIEGEITAQSLQTALAMKTHYGWRSTGAVVPVNDADANRALRQANFGLMGKFQWWQHDLSGMER